MNNNILDNCEKLAREIAFSTGRVEDLNQYFAIQNLKHDVESAGLDAETYNEQQEQVDDMTTLL